MGNKKIVFSDGKDTYWTINTNGFSDWYVNKENLIKIKKPSANLMPADRF